MLENKLREIRKSKGLMQAELAKKIGISTMSYQRYEKGKRVPSVNHAILIAEALNSTVEELFKKE